MNNEMMLEMFMEIEIRGKAVDLLKYVGKFDYLDTMSDSQSNLVVKKVNDYRETVEKFASRFSEEMKSSIESNYEKVMSLVIAHDENVLNTREDEKAVEDLNFEIREQEYNLSELKECIYQ